MRKTRDASGASRARLCTPALHPDREPDGHLTYAADSTAD
jgi:hypothetical protein